MSLIVYSTAKTEAFTSPSPKDVMLAKEQWLLFQQRVSIVISLFLLHKHILEVVIAYHFFLHLQVIE